MYRRLMLLWAACAAAVGAAPLPYDESADARAEIRSALAAVGKGPRRVLIVFGANWCEDCRSLDTALKSGRNAELMAREFEVVKVDVGRFDRNTDIADSYGVPLKKGIPAVAILSRQGKVVYATQAGELADARQMGDKGIFDFFTKAAALAK